MPKLAKFKQLNLLNLFIDNPHLDRDLICLKVIPNKKLMGFFFKYSKTKVEVIRSRIYLFDETFF